MYVYGGVYVYYMWVYAYVHQYIDYNVITGFQEFFKNFFLTFFVFPLIWWHGGWGIVLWNVKSLK